MNSILLISAPGAGKGVISRYLEKRYKFVHISIGDLLRNEAKSNEDVKKIISLGDFVSNELVFELIDKFMSNHKDSNYVFEGFPRMMEQISYFEDLLNKHNVVLDKVLFIDIDKEIAEKRITGRLICPSCNNVYNKYFDKIELNKCNNCSSDLIKRSDDKLSTYEKRYKTFKEKTIPLLDYYKERDLLFTISNNGEISETYNKVDKVINN